MMQCNEDLFFQNQTKSLDTKGLQHKKNTIQNIITDRIQPFLIILFSVLSLIGIDAQTTQGSLTGKVTMVDGEPLTSISVSLLDTDRQTLTDDAGIYKFGNLNAGQYTIKLQILGSKEVRLPVEVKAGENTQLDYQLTKENIMAIQEVVIMKNTNRFSKKESVYVARLPLKNMENPQVYNTVTKELFQEQVAVDLGSISKNVPGAGVPMIANQGRVTFRSRGFETEPNARNGVAGAAFSVIDPVNLERIEAIKGPSATLFGKSVASSYGGVYNRVTKKPYNDFGGEVGYVGGSWNYNRLTLDVNTPVNKDRTALFRLNAAGTYEKSFQDLGFTNSLAIAPSFSYQITDRMSLLLDVEFNQAKGTSVVRFNPYTGSNKIQSIADMKFPYYKNFLSDDLAYETQMMNIFAQLNYKISDKWTSQTIISRARSTINGYISAINGKTDSTASAQVMVGTTSFIATNIQQNFIGDFHIGRFRNRMVVGLDYYNNSNHFDRYHTNTKIFNFVHPSADFRVNRNTIDALTATSAVRKENNGDNTYAAYVSDVFNITDQLMVMASLRVDRFQFKGVYDITTGEIKGGLSNSGVQAGPYGQTAFSPKLGIVYEVLKNKLSLFGNYMNGFNNVSGVDINGNSFRPEYANQLEFGVKTDLFNHKLVGTLSYYNIRVDNVLRTNPDDINYSIQDGTQLSKGMEAEITVNPFDGLNIVAGYAYNDSKYSKANPAVNGLRPALSGPANMFNYWISYRIPQGKLKGLGIGTGANMGSSSYQTNTQTSKVIIPSYKMFDIGIFYDQPKYRVGLKFDNITNEKAWSVRLTPQAPARFLGSVSLKF
ncbi:TonB-dependent receptor [Elizabethkingia miricola]|uniref:TonB-dependent receptor n=1 Tax=Elizabethkingia miricola TaxID=172045 RepID=UPI001F1A15D9|nr:TonB-dependent receptor [Elizabethkingia miricola]UIO95427.1 TonB-dependent receptor [Elizabethkingia miricola]WER12225.1 TonB-dependent receptor [Elizabethkingia miricola]WGL72401.1 TonB-dependent receptor [Elizabethkingia miricola]WNG64196.1 TonB-dependent receptor [Elizabethkingia miricola]